MFNCGGPPPCTDGEVRLEVPGLFHPKVATRSPCRTPAASARRRAWRPERWYSAYVYRWMPEKSRRRPLSCRTETVPLKHRGEGSGVRP